MHTIQFTKCYNQAFNFSPNLPANIHWEPSSYENWENNDGSKTKTGSKLLSDKSSSDKASAFNTFSWPSNTWADKAGGAGDSQWMRDVRSQVKSQVKSQVQTTSAPHGQTQVHSWTPTSAWQHNTWSTSTSSTVSPSPVWTTRAAKRVATRQSVLTAPSEPTKPLGETAVTWASNSWPGLDSDSFSNTKYTQSDVLSSVGQTTTRSPADRKRIQQRDQILAKNYFFTPSPQPLHVRDKKVQALKPAQFQSEFTAFHSNLQKKAFDRFDTNFQTGNEEEFGRLKKEIKTSDQEDTYFQHGHHDSSALDTQQDKSNVVSMRQNRKSIHQNRESKDQIQMLIPDPLAPGHPMGNGNHGWAPIEEWARGHISGALDSPAWADSQVTLTDWSDRMTVKTSPPPVIHWTSPAPVIYQSSTPSPVRLYLPSPSPAAFISPSSRSYQSPSPTSFNSPSPLPFKRVTPTPYNSSVSPVTTVAPSEVSTMRYPSTPMTHVLGSPVTPMYHTQFGDYASLDLQHLSGPTGPPGLQLFKSLAPGNVVSGHQVPHSNSHYMEQNPFLVSPLPPDSTSVTATTAASVKRNIVADLYNYNPSDR